MVLGNTLSTKAFVVPLTRSHVQNGAVCEFGSLLAMRVGHAEYGIVRPDIVLQTGMGQRREHWLVRCEDVERVTGKTWRGR